MDEIERPNGVGREREKIVLAERRTSGRRSSPPADALCNTRTRESVLSSPAAAPGIVRPVPSDLAVHAHPDVGDGQRHKRATQRVLSTENVSTATMALTREPTAHVRLPFGLRRGAMQGTCPFWMAIHDEVSLCERYRRICWLR